jgi:pyrimidine-specific ribonucleoside hydrolase
MDMTKRSWGLQGARVLLCAILGGCAGAQPSAPGSTSPGTTGATTTPATAPSSTASAAPSPTTAPTKVVPAVPVTLLVDTDVAGDDLVALAFLLSAPNVTLAAITVSGTGEAHCAGGVDVVLRLLDRLKAPQIPVACGRETPLVGDHAFPDPWREHVDSGAGLDLAATSRKPSTSSAVELIVDLSKQHDGLHVLTLGPLTNLADALKTEPALAKRLGPVTMMGGAVHVPGNLLCCGAPEGNTVAEWNIYVDPHAASVVIDSGLHPAFVSLDGTNQVPVTAAFVNRIMAPTDSPALGLVAELFRANPFMTAGTFYLWDPLAAEVAAGYPIGSLTPVAISVEEQEGPESGFTRPVDGAPNCTYLSKVDAGAAEDTLLRILRGG